MQKFKIGPRIKKKKKKKIYIYISSRQSLPAPPKIKWSLPYPSAKLRDKRKGTVVTAFFMSTETHAKRFLTVWKRSVSPTLKRSFTVLANQIIVSETFQAFQILTNHINVRKTLSWKPCLVSNVLAFAELANQNPADSIYFTSFFFFFFFFFFFSQFHLIIIVIKLIKIIVK